RRTGKHAAAFVSARLARQASLARVRRPIRARHAWTRLRGRGASRASRATRQSQRSEFLFHHISIITGLAGVLTLASCAVDRATADPDVRATGQDVAASECPPNTPPALAPAADQRLAFVLSAQGVQRYQC